MQMDKLGHTMSAYKLTKTLSDVYEWSGLSPQKSRLLSATIATGYMSAIEIMDGFSSDWGFSMSDMGANLIGSGLFLFQEKYFWNGIALTWLYINNYNPKKTVLNGK